MFRGFPEWPIYILMILLALFFSVLVIKAVYDPGSNFSLGLIAK